MKLFTLAAATIASLLLTGLAVIADEITIKFSHIVAENTPKGLFGQTENCHVRSLKNHHPDTRRGQEMASRFEARLNQI